MNFDRIPNELPFKWSLVYIAIMTTLVIGGMIALAIWAVPS